MASLLDQLIDQQSGDLEQPRPVQTRDASYTLYQPDLDENFHSLFGARQESQHVFIENGLRRYMDVREETTQLSLLEVGFGTGLNLMLTAKYLKEHALTADYHTIEPNPLPPDLLKHLNEKNGYEDWSVWETFYHAYAQEHPQENTKLAYEWHLPAIDFRLHKTTLLGFYPQQTFEMIYYDAFSPTVQPEMWNRESLEKVTELLKPGGMLVTYCIRGYIKRTLKELGLVVQALPGAPGKREMLMAIQPC
jgi:tRNA U34 5-methylaminomethyl-2-thiouridine-forming methyltransferase MnmC